MKAWLAPGLLNFGDYALHPGEEWFNELGDLCCWKGTAMHAPQPKIAKAPQWSDAKSITVVTGISLVVVALLFGVAGHANPAPPEQVLISTQ